MIERALTGDRRYWGWILALVALITVGSLFYLRQLTVGLTITGLSRDVTWGFYIAQFTFMVGVAASAVMVVLPYYLHDYKAFGKMTILGEFLAIPAVIMCMAFIFVDMGMPNRIVNVFLHPTVHSMMFWDTVALGGYLVLNVLISRVTLQAERRGNPPPDWIKPIIILSIPWAISIHTVTAFVYNGLPARPFWNTGVLAPLFLVSGLSTAAALVALLTRDHGERAWFTRIDIVLIVLELALVALFIINLATGSAAQIQALDCCVMGGAYTFAFWVLFVGIGDGGRWPEGVVVAAEVDVTSIVSTSMPRNRQ